MTHPFPLPEFARDLPPKFTDGSAVFNDRVRSKFSATQKETEIVNELRKEGFKIIDGVNEVGRRQAILSGSKFPCKLLWKVSWRVDKVGVISDVMGYYGEAGCL